MSAPVSPHQTAVEAVHAGFVWALGVLGSLGLGKLVIPPLVEALFNWRKRAREEAERRSTAARRSQLDEAQDAMREEMRDEMRKLIARLERVETELESTRRENRLVRECLIKTRAIAESDRRTIRVMQEAGKLIDLATFLPFPEVPSEPQLTGQEIS